MASLHRCLKSVAILRQSSRTGMIAMPPSQKVRPIAPSLTVTSSMMGRLGSWHPTTNSQIRLRSTDMDDSNENDDWCDVFPLEDGSHQSAKVTIPKFQEANTNENNLFDRKYFMDRLNATTIACREMNKSSLWIKIHMSRASLIEDMESLGFRFHNAQGSNATLNLWLKESESMIPEFATHHVGVGGFVVNSRNEILCVRELRKNYSPWKIPGGLSELGEHIDEAVTREVLEETGIQTKFRKILCFRHTHGMALGRSDLYFVCQLDPVEEKDSTGNIVIPKPTPQPGEIEAAIWMPLEEFREMVAKTGHPMIRHVLKLYDQGHSIDKEIIGSLVPGRKPSPMYAPFLKTTTDDKEDD